MGDRIVYWTLVVVDIVILALVVVAVACLAMAILILVSGLVLAEPKMGARPSSKPKVHHHYPYRVPPYRII